MPAEQLMIPNVRSTRARLHRGRGGRCPTRKDVHSVQTMNAVLSERDETERLP